MSALLYGAARSNRIRSAAYLVVGVLIALLALIMGEFSWQLWIFALAPDLPLIFGGGPALQPGQLNPKAVPFYNATHRLAGPVLLTLAALISIGLGSSNGRAFLAGGLVWTAHILLDRGLGYGLRTAEGFQRGHEGRGGGAS
jgi:hypothetical protein